jgi:hypothetical protein
MLSDPPLSQSLFERLPYDILANIYEYLKPTVLPPRWKGFPDDLSGFMLSCRFAKNDLEEELEKFAATEHVKDIASFKIAEAQRHPQTITPYPNPSTQCPRTTSTSLHSTDSNDDERNQRNCRA